MSTVVWNACLFGMWIEWINVLNTSLPNLEIYVYSSDDLVLSFTPRQRRALYWEYTELSKISWISCSVCSVFSCGNENLGRMGWNEIQHRGGQRFGSSCYDSEMAVPYPTAWGVSHIKWSVTIANQMRVGILDYLWLVCLWWVWENCCCFVLSTQQNLVEGVNETEM